MEMIDLYDNKRVKLNKTVIRNEWKANPGEYKLSVHVWLLNSKGEFLIQKRSATMDKNPNKWAYTGGAVESGETSLEGAIRETEEELGINVDINKIEYLLSYKKEKGIVDVWLIKDDIDIRNMVIEEDEVSAVKWVTKQELEELIKNDEFVSMDLYYELFIKLLVKFYGLKI